MYNKIIFGFLLFSTCLFAQQKKIDWYVQLGGAYSTFQDQKFSDVRYRGIGTSIEIGFQKERPKKLWGILFRKSSTNEKPKTHNATKAITGSCTLDIKYLYRVSNKFMLGLDWSVFDFYDKQFTNLGNNSQNFVASSTLWVSGIYDYKKFRFGTDFGIVSYVKEGISFAFSAPQKYLEDGQFSYLDENASNLLGIEQYNFRSISKNFQLRTSIKYQYNKRWSVVYNWEVRRLVEVQNYPLTYGIHTLGIRYNFVSKLK